MPDNPIQILHPFFFAPERAFGFPPVLSYGFPRPAPTFPTFKVLSEHTDITQCLPYGFQHDPVKYLFPDIVDFAGAGVALVVGANEMILAVILVGVAGAEIQLGSAVGAVGAGRRICWSLLFLSACVCSSAVPVPVPTVLLSMTAGWVSSKTRWFSTEFSIRFEFQGLGIGLETRYSPCTPAAQYPGDRFGTPLIKILRHGPAFLPGVISGNGRYLIGCEDFSDLHGSFPAIQRLKIRRTTFAASSSINPFLFVLRVFYVTIRRVAGKMFPGFAPHFHQLPGFSCWYPWRSSR